MLVLWLLLATRAAARLEAWAKSVFPEALAAGTVVFCRIDCGADGGELPVDMFGHYCERAIRHQRAGLGKLVWDQAKALGLAVVLGSLVMLLFHWIVRKWPRRYWFGVWVATLPLMVLAVFVSPLSGADLQQIRTAGEEPCCAGG